MSNPFLPAAKAPAWPPAAAHDTSIAGFVAACYDDLLRIARSRLWRNGRSTMLGTTALVNETWLRLAERHGVAPASRGAFLAYASQTMRSIIVDAARQRLADKRGAGQGGLSLDALPDGVAPEAGESFDVLRVHEALDDLARREPRLAGVVVMRFFGGCTTQEVATALQCAPRTVERDWEKARILLLDALMP